MEKVRKDLKPLKDLGKGVVLFGSVLTEYFIPGRSDIDVAVVTMNEDKDYNLKILEKTFLYNRKPYDIKVFELLPLGVRFEIIKNYFVLFGDPVEISYYFYKYWKLYRDMAPRMEREKIGSLDEIREGKERLRKIRGE